MFGTFLILRVPIEYLILLAKIPKTKNAPIKLSNDINIVDLALYCSDVASCILFLSLVMCTILLLRSTAACLDVPFTASSMSAI